MRPRKPDPTPQSDMFRERLEAILDPRHELLRLAARIDRDRLDALYGATFVQHVGRPGLPTRLMVWLHLPKHIKGLSDETVYAAWVENPYFQAFCVETHFQHRLPADRSSMTNWCERMDAGRLEALLAETISAGKTSHIHRKKPKGKPMPKAVARANARKSKVRARVEHVFAEQEDRMGLFIRMKRWCWLDRRSASA